MAKIKSLLLGMALVLPLAAFGAIGDVTSTGAEAVPAELQAPTSQIRCCWVFYNGVWYCITLC
jgi:hypothetical protein